MTIMDRHEDRIPVSEEESDKGSILKTLSERPLGIGLWFGMGIGALNAYILGLTYLTSVAIGGALGLVVCTFGCPHMRTRLKARKMRRNQNAGEKVRVRATSAFSTFD